MTPNKVLKTLQTKELLRCEVTGKFYPADECEVVIIKIIKSKKADINQLFKKEESINIETKQYFNPAKKEIEKALDEDKEPIRPIINRKPIIPPAFLSMMTPHDMPGAAVETRHA